MTNIVTINNKSIRGLRKEKVYQAMVIDLARLGVITEAQAQKLLGGSIPRGICLPGESPAPAVPAPNVPERPADDDELPEEEEGTEEGTPEDEVTE